MVYGGVREYHVKYRKGSLTSLGVNFDGALYFNGHSCHPLVHYHWSVVSCDLSKPLGRGFIGVVGGDMQCAIPRGGYLSFLWGEALRESSKRVSSSE